MQAQITAPMGFRIAPEGHTVFVFKSGEIVKGTIAEKAILAGAARRIDELSATLEHKSETPEPKRRGRPRKVTQ